MFWRAVERRGGYRRRKKGSRRRSARRKTRMLEARSGRSDARGPTSFLWTGAQPQGWRAKMAKGSPHSHPKRWMMWKRRRRTMPSPPGQQVGLLCQSSFLRPLWQSIPDVRDILLGLPRLIIKKKAGFAFSSAATVWFILFCCALFAEDSWFCAPPFAATPLISQ